MSKKLKNELVLSLMKERIRKELEFFTGMSRTSVKKLTDRIMYHIIFAAKSID